MAFKSVLIAALTGSAIAHSVIPLVTGDDGNAETGLGFDPKVPTTGTNKNPLETHAGTMPGIDGPGLGTLNDKKRITMDMLATAVANGKGGQIPAPAKTLDVDYRQIVIDGRYDEKTGGSVLLNAAADANFRGGAQKLQVLKAPEVIKQAIARGTTVVDQDLDMKVQLPDNYQCTGPNHTCLLRIVNGNNEGNEHWGGEIVMQSPTTTTTVPAAGAAAAGTSTAATTAGVAGAKANNAKAGRAVGVRTIVKRNAPIMARDGGVNKLIEDLKKIQVRSDPVVKPRDGTADPTYEGMLAFEEKWAKEHPEKK